MPFLINEFLKILVEKIPQTKKDLKIASDSVGDNIFYH